MLRTGSNASGIGHRARRIGYLLVPGFSNLNFSALLEPFRLANIVDDNTHYQWVLYSVDGKPVPSSSRIHIPVDGSLFDTVDVDDLFVVAGYDYERSCNPKLFSRLRNIVRQGCNIGGFGTGALILAEAGLLDGYKATVHWETRERMLDRYHRVDIVSDRYVIDRGRYSSGGAIASLDMALNMIADVHGKGFAVGLASRFIYSQDHPASEPQMLLDTGEISWRDPYVGKAMVLMKRHMSSQITIAEIARQAGIGLRGLQRRFLNVLSQSPHEYYRNMRLDTGRKLVLYSGRTIEEIAQDTGFASGSAFSRAFRQRYDESPTSLRNMGKT